MKAIRDAAYVEFAIMLGANIRFCRARTNKPQKTLAHALGVTHQNVQKYEAGKVVPTAFRLKIIADFYEVKADDLLDPSFIHRQTKTPQDAGYLKPQKDIGSLEEIKSSFDVSKYEDFEDEYPMPLSHLEHDPKMRATYDAILEDE